MFEVSFTVSVADGIFTKLFEAGTEEEAKQHARESISNLTSVLSAIQIGSPVTA